MSTAFFNLMASQNKKTNMDFIILRWSVLTSLNSKKKAVSVMATTNAFKLNSHDLIFFFANNRDAKEKENH